MLTIRPATPEDLPAVVEVMNAISPDNLTSVEELVSQDARRREDIVFRRFVGVLNDASGDRRVVGVARFDQDEWVYHPHKFYFGVSVHPNQHGLGIGKALYDHTLRELMGFDPIKLTAFTREDRARAMRFLHDRGWQEEMRSWESRLDLNAFDSSGFADALERAQSNGYKIVTFASLEADPERDRKYYELDTAASHDMPHSPGASLTTPTFERYWTNVHNNPNFDPALWFVAVKDGVYAGLTQLYGAASPNMMHTGFTAVARGHRGQGLGLALKVTALTRAKSLGIQEVETSNAQSNRFMLRINEALGFEKQPAWIEFVLRLGEETPS